MATKLMKDYRNPAQNRVIYQPYWISSLEVSGLNLGSAEAYVAACFSFPAAKYGDSIINIEKACIQVTEAFAGGTITVDVGAYTIPLETSADEATITIVDADEFIPTADITSGTIGLYWAATGDWITAKLLMTEGAPVIQTPADATVPTVGLYMTTDGTLTAGKARVHMLVTEVPLV